MKAEKRSKLLTLEEWKTQAMETGGKEVKIESFPNVDEPAKPGSPVAGLLQRVMMFFILLWIEVMALRLFRLAKA